VSEDPASGRLTRAVRSLTVAVWCLCVLLVVQLGRDMPLAKLREMVKQDEMAKQKKS